jgi:anti-sigma B factor antagonist
MPGEVNAIQRVTRSSYCPMGAINISVEQKGSITIVEMAGELDSISAPEAQDQILPLVKRECKILLDMSSVIYMSSAGLRTLLLLYRQIRDNLGEVIISGLGDEVRDVMALTGFLDFFQTVESRSDGLRLLSG